MKAWIKKYEKEAALLAGMLVALAMFLGNPFGVDAKAKLVLSIAFLMIVWWVLDAMPLAVVALTPLVLFPLLNINSIKDTSKSYSDSVIFLFMGGFFWASPSKNGTCTNASPCASSILPAPMATASFWALFWPRVS